jgi:hypothetical protein
MIIYGSKGKQLAKELLPDNCPHCGTPHSITMYVFQNYAHIFWIPFFPIEKRVVTECAHCKQVLKPKQMPSYFQPYYENLKSRSRIPVWMFSGLGLIGLLIVIGFVSESMKSQKVAKLIQSPRAGDVFEVKTNADKYTLFKISGVQGDSVLVQFNNYETDAESGVDQIRDKGDTAFSQNVFSILKGELKTMEEKGQILDIDRE